MGYWGKSMKSWIPWWPFYYLTSSSLFLDKKSVDKPPLYRVLMSVLGGWSGGHGRGAGSEGTYRRVVITLYRVNQGKEGSYIKWVGLIAWKKWGRLTNLDRFHKGIFMWSISTDSVGPYIRFFFFTSCYDTLLLYPYSWLNVTIHCLSFGPMTTLTFEWYFITDLHILTTGYGCPEGVLRSSPSSLVWIADWGCGHWSLIIWVRILALLLHRSVALGKLLTSNGSNNAPIP